MCYRLNNIEEKKLTKETHCHVVLWVTSRVEFVFP